MKKVIPNWINQKPAGFTDIPRYSGRYAINRKGVIYSYPKYRWKGKILKTHLIPSHKGYYEKVTLIDENGRKRVEGVHRLLLETYNSHIDSNTLQVNHKNGIKHDNRLQNLEWCTASENMKHAVVMGLRPVTGRMIENFRGLGRKYGKMNGMIVCKPILQISSDGKVLKSFISTMEASRHTGLSYRNINNALRLKTKGKNNRKAGGFYWRYKTEYEAIEAAKKMLNALKDNQ